MRHRQHAVRNSSGRDMLRLYASARGPGDIVAGFEHESDAERFQAEPRERLERFALTLQPDKTRLIEFGRYATDNRKKRGLGKPATFTFLGFTHICGRSRAVYFQLKRVTPGPYAGQAEGPQSGTASAHACADPGARTLAGPGGPRLLRVSRGADQYPELGRDSQPCHRTLPAVAASLRRRSQKDWTTSERISRLVAAYLPPPADPSSLARGAFCGQTSVRGAPGDGRPYRDRAPAIKSFSGEAEDRGRGIPTANLRSHQVVYPYVA
jgi:hypothetical protein